MKKGFTLIELMTVIAIIGVLAAIVIPNIIHVSKGRSSVSVPQKVAVCYEQTLWEVKNGSPHKQIMIKDQFDNPIPVPCE